VIILFLATTLPAERSGFDAPPPPLSLTHKVKSIANYNNARGGGQAGEFN
jgi:hypothetical protein